MAATAKESSLQPPPTPFIPVQEWANSQGGLVAALAHPAMPAAGTPLRAAVEAALRQRIDTSIPHDAGYWFEDEDEYAEDPGEGTLGHARLRACTRRQGLLSVRSRLEWGPAQGQLKPGTSGTLCRGRCQTSLTSCREA